MRSTQTLVEIYNSYFYRTLSKYFFRALHEQLDDDNDGTIEPSETGDFIREDLQYRGSNDKQQQQMRQKKFHGQVNTTANKACSMGRAKGAAAPSASLKGEKNRFGANLKNSLFC